MPAERFSNSEATTTIRRFRASVPSVSMLGPGIDSASLKRRASSL